MKVLIVWTGTMLLLIAIGAAGLYTAHELGMREGYERCQSAHKAWEKQMTKLGVNCWPPEVGPAK